MVGDPKQSIYRFRRADIVTYSEVKRIIKQHGELVALTTNFRSQKPVIDWVNTTFEKVLPTVADKYSPAHCSMVSGQSPSEDKAGVEVLNVPEEYGTNPEALAYEPDVISQVIHNAVAPQSKTEPPAKPGEFMIIAALKKNLSRYAQQLSELGIPSQVTGGAVLSEIHELSLLCLCLEAVTQPDNPVALVARMRSELFGISDTALYTFKAAGGRFSFHTKIPEGLSADIADPLADAFSRLHRYDMWLKTFPPVAAVERIVADLGLVASAAAERGGNTLAGGMARAVELLRAAQSTATSISELAAYLREVVDGAESHDAVPAASPSQAPVRIMNLHQAKGLEAPVVFLADPTGAFSHDPQIHIDRSGDGPTRGYLAILGSSNNFHRPLLAYPERWQEFAEEEGKFQKAEKNRLLYVAATRAGNRLIITQREEGNRWNPWSPLNAHLDGCEHLEVPKIAAPPKTSGVTVGDEEPIQAANAIGERWQKTLARSYALVAAKAISVSGSVPGATSGEHGTEWGTVIHALLEAALRDSSADLHNFAYASLQHEGLDPARADEAIAVVQSVMASDIWKRAQMSDHRLMEVPFHMLMPTDSADGNAVPTLLRGVIDLAFHEPKGWVIVDYKTDARPRSYVPALVDHYRGQVETYADVWRTMTGLSVVEKGLYFTHVGIYSTV